MKAYLVWEVVDDYPEAGGGDYLEEIFLDEDKAKNYCEQLNKENESKEVKYAVSSWEVEE